MMISFFKQKNFGRHAWFIQKYVSVIRGEVYVITQSDASETLIISNDIYILPTEAIQIITFIIENSLIGITHFCKTQKYIGHSKS